VWQESRAYSSRADPLAKDAATKERNPDYAVTVVGLLLYSVVVAGVLVLLDIE
jgi:RPA family protein